MEAKRRTQNFQDGTEGLFHSINGSEDASLGTKSFSFLDILRLVGSTTAGVIFGIALEKGRVFEPLVIQDQMLMHRFVMMKMFLSAVSTGMFCLSALAMIEATRNKVYHAIGPAFHAGFKNKGIFSMIIGAGILGCGMTIAGACPGMVLAQVGSGTPNSLYTLTGGLTAAFVYGIIEPTLTNLLKPSRSLRQYTLHEHLQSPYVIVALPMASVIATAVFGLELYAPWTSEVVTSTASSWFEMKAWPPYIAGFLIGLLQVPVVLMVKDTLGSSSSYCTVVSVTTSLWKFPPYLRNYQFGVNNWWQVFYVGGAILGGYMSAEASHSWGSTPGVSPLMGFTGGFLMLFGSRIAAGCTSGHGLSGMGALSLLSFVAVPAMFAGGIGTAVLMRSFGML